MHEMQDGRPVWTNISIQRPENQLRDTAEPTLQMALSSPPHTLSLLFFPSLHLCHFLSFSPSISLSLPLPPSPFSRSPCVCVCACVTPSLAVCVCVCVCVLK